MQQGPDLAGVERLALFADMGPDEFDAALSQLRPVSFREGEWILRQGQSAPGVFVILDGQASVVIDGEEIGVLSRGSFFGEISVLLGEAATADIVARTPLECLAIDAPAVEGFLVDHPPFMLRLLQAEARRLRDAGRGRN
jgi:CRP/FNR family cyclic AMP-dependent transcriptional regulator